MYKIELWSNAGYLIEYTLATRLYVIDMVLADYEKRLKNVKVIIYNGCEKIQEVQL